MTTTSPFTVDSSTAANNRLLANTVGKQSTGKQTIDMNGYLKLLTAQIQYQDPFQPVDNTQMVAQMAQFSSLAAQTESNTTLKSISDALSGQRLSDAASWIGKSMLVKSNVIGTDTAGQYMGQVTVPAESSDVAVDLVDDGGKVVKTIDLGAQKGGDVPFYWDGTDGKGNRIASGQLGMRVRGSTGATTAAWTPVAAVRSPSSGSDAKLITPLGSFTAADALSIS